MLYMFRESTRYLLHNATTQSVFVKVGFDILFIVGEYRCLQPCIHERNFEKGIS